MNSVAVRSIGLRTSASGLASILTQQSLHFRYHCSTKFTTYQLRFDQKSIEG